MDLAGTSQYSKYFNTLNQMDRKRYIEKTQVIGHVDPYALPRERYTEDVSQWPAVIHSDIVQYLVYTTSYVTTEEMRAYKSLQS